MLGTLVADEGKSDERRTRSTAAGGAKVNEKLAELVARARQVRKPLPRWLWAAALVLGVACLGAFVWMYLQPAGTPTTPARQHVEGPGFASGTVIGTIAGFLVGWATARYRADHSSRNNP